MPPWFAPLLAVLVLQTVHAFLSRTIPTLAPELTAEAGLPATVVGYATALGTAGSVALLAMAPPVIRRYGAVRALQGGALVAILGTLLLLVPYGPILFAAALLTGIGYAPSSPAGSDVLARHAPKGHQGLVFSVKQAGVPAGGMIAGLILPLIAETWGWRWAIVFVAIVCALAILAVNTTRARVDAERDPNQRVTLALLFSRETLLASLRAVTLKPILPILTAGAFCFAISQGVWFNFLVTYAVVGLGRTLSEAGQLFAAMMAVGIFGRVAIGFVADRLGSGLWTLVALAVASAATTTALAFTSTAWSPGAILALSALAGLTISSWNGLHLSEIARAAPRSAIAEVTAGSTFITFMGYVIGPAAFAAIVELAGYRTGFLVAATITLIGATILLRGARRPREES